MKTSLLIYAIPQHAWHIPAIIHEYECAPERPDEYVISLSQSNLVPRYLDECIIRSAGVVKLLRSEAELTCGQNRQFAADHATGDVLISQDADDFPHHQRVAVLKHFFRDPNVSIVTHSYYHREQARPWLEPGEIRVVRTAELYARYFPAGRIEDCLRVTQAYGSGWGIDAGGGVSAVRRSVLDHVRWLHFSELVLRNGELAEDYEFLMAALFKLKRSILIDAKIYCYNHFKGYNRILS
jgi:hypothetical protein